MTSATEPPLQDRDRLPSARRLLLWTGLAVLLAWVLVPIYLVALGAFGGRLGVFRWPKSIWPTDLSLRGDDASSSPSRACSTRCSTRSSRPG